MISVNFKIFRRKIVNWILIGITIAILCVYPSIFSLDNYDEYLVIQFTLLMMIFMPIILILIQSYGFALFSSTYALTRVQSVKEAYLRLVLFDVVVALIYSLIVMITCYGVMFAINAPIQIEQAYIVLYFVLWMLMYTMAKHIANLFIGEYRTSSLIAMALVIVVYILDGRVGVFYNWWVSIVMTSLIIAIGIGLILMTSNQEIERILVE